MRRYLVVANRTLGGGHLADEIRRCIAAGPCRFHIVVPATPPGDHPWTESEARAVAAARLEAAIARFRNLASEVDGEVGDARPIQAISDVLGRGEDFDEIILSTLPPGLSRWLRLDLPHRVEGQFGLPLIHVIGEPEPVQIRPGGS